MDTVFWVCVRLMVITAHILHISYQQLNVLLFVILHPLFTAWCYWRYRVFRKRWELVTAR